MNAEQRFWDKVVKTPTCWLWSGSKTPLGYSRFRYDGKAGYAHRYSLSLVEKLDGIKEIDHLCRNRGCVNPEHLEQTTHLENLRRSPIHFINNPTKRANCGVIATHCKYGHLKEPNTYQKLICKICRIERVKKYYKTKKGKKRKRTYAREYYRQNLAKTTQRRVHL